MTTHTASVRRFADNPILLPSQLQPSRPDFEVVGVFNPAAIRVGDETILLLRVAEAPRDVAPNLVASPIYDPESNSVRLRTWSRDTPGLKLDDSRLIVVGRDTFLTSISHFRRARSKDGLHFEVEARPVFSPQHALEAFGVEDPRITRIGDTFWLNYTAVSSAGIATGLASSRDLRHFERHGIIFSPPNRDVTIFPEQIGGRYWALHRPMASEPGENAIWSATSPDLLDW